VDLWRITGLTRKIAKGTSCIGKAMMLDWATSSHVDYSCRLSCRAFAVTILANAITVARSPSVVVEAVGWIQALLLGSVATGVAVLAVAFVGFGMLAGRLDWRTGARVVLGIFILFGAPAIVQGLRSAVSEDGGAAPAPDNFSREQAAPKVPDLKRSADPFDPYAGQQER
jgi:type IV secretory pathway VirB2 component (pilin)